MGRAGQRGDAPADARRRGWHRSGSSGWLAGRPRPRSPADSPGEAVRRGVGWAIRDARCGCTRAAAAIVAARMAARSPLAYDDLLALPGSAPTPPPPSRASASGSGMRSSTPTSAGSTRGSSDGAADAATASPTVARARRGAGRWCRSRDPAALQRRRDGAGRGDLPRPRAAVRALPAGRRLRLAVGRPAGGGGRARRPQTVTPAPTGRPAAGCSAVLRDAPGRSPDRRARCRLGRRRATRPGARRPDRRRACRARRRRPLPAAGVTTTAFAHRGGRHGPDNPSRPSPPRCAQGANGLETDAWLTRDGAVVLDHDGVAGSRPRRRRQPIAQVRRDQLPAHIPTLDELYDALRHGLSSWRSTSRPAPWPPPWSPRSQRARRLRPRLWLVSPAPARLGGLDSAHRAVTLRGNVIRSTQRRTRRVPRHPRRRHGGGQRPLDVVDAAAVVDEVHGAGHAGLRLRLPAAASRCDGRCDRARRRSSATTSTPCWQHSPRRTEVRRHRSAGRRVARDCAAPAVASAVCTHRRDRPRPAARPVRSAWPRHGR